MNQEDIAMNNSHPQIHDDEKILTNLFKENGRMYNRSASKHVGCLNEA